MEDPRKASLQPLVQAWAQNQAQALRARVLRVLDEAAGPDDALVAQILAALPAALEPAPFEEGPVDAERELGAALDLLEAAASQGEVLKNLLEGLQPFVERSALFVVKPGAASLYAQRGFESDQPRLGASVAPNAELDALMQGQSAGVAEPGPAYLALLKSLSRFEAADARILPLRLRRKPVALLLVDSGIRQVIDQPHHVRALVRAAEAALSSQAAQKEEERTAAAPVSALPPAQPSAPTQRLPEPAAEPAAPALDPKIRANAERSARVLVGDIELYFPAKVVQGTTMKNLYAVLRDELDRSRASFVDRYGQELEAQHYIFYQTVVQQLCAGDPAILGPVPWAPK